MKRWILILWGASTLAIGGVAWWYLFSAGTVPEGQPPLGGEEAFREAFQRNVSKNRMVALLSPTTPGDLAIAQLAQTLLTEYENDPLDVHIVWQPLAPADWAPTTDAMARVSDPRTRHYWDKELKVRKLVGEGRVLIYARGAGLDSPSVRVTDWVTGEPKIKEFLGVPTRPK